MEKTPCATAPVEPEAVDRALVEGRPLEALRCAVALVGASEVQDRPAGPDMTTPHDVVGIDWRALLGPRSTAVLDAGMKLEIEGATNDGLYDDGFEASLRRWMRRRLA